MTISVYVRSEWKARCGIGLSRERKNERESRYRDEPNEIVAVEPLASHPIDVYTPDTTRRAVYTFSLINAKMFVGALCSVSINKRARRNRSGAMINPIRQGVVVVVPLRLTRILARID